MTHPKIKKHRQNKPIEELFRKRQKAMRKGWWTEEDIDYAKSLGKLYAKLLQGEPTPPHFKETIDKHFFELS